MGSIPKIVLTPAKWASKKLLHATLLRFPGGGEPGTVACAYCPEMCRFSCPTAVVSGNDAVTPSNKMSLLYQEQNWPGQATAQGAVEPWPIYDCTGCGRCTEYCVYGVPVAETLMAARAEYGWTQASRALPEITEAEDPVGDLAEELGDLETAARRRQRFVALRTSNADLGSEILRVEEPKQLKSLLDAGVPAELSWQGALSGDPAIAERLRGKTWLVHESSWLSRRLDRAADAQAWVARARAAGVELRMPFESGRDCHDCGGEGAYARLFADQAAAMARDFWERDKHRADGIVTFSRRCAEHLRRALPGVPVEFIGESAASRGKGGDA